MVRFGAFLRAVQLAVMANALLVVGGLVVLLLSIAYVLEHHARAGEAKAYRALLEAKAVELGGVVGVNRSQKEIIRQLTAEQVDFVRLLKKTGRGELDSALRTRAVFKDRIQFVEVPESPGGAAHWSDAHGRFSLALPDGTFDRNQAFDYSAVVVRSRDGKSRVAREVFTELDPRTGETITDENPPVLTTSFEFVETGGPAKLARRLLGFWPVVGLDVAARPIAGARVFDLERTGRPVLKDFGLGLLAGYDRKDKNGFAGAFVGYRILGSNVEAVGYYGATTSGTARAGAGLVFEVTR